MCSCGKQIIKIDKCTENRENVHKLLNLIEKETSLTDFETNYSCLESVL